MMTCNSRQGPTSAPDEAEGLTSPETAQGATYPDGSWASCMRRAAVRVRRGENVRAAQLFARALALRPGHAPTLHQLGAACLRARDYAPAARAFEALLERDPRNADGLQGLGLAMHGLGKAGPALEAFRRAARLSPGAVKAWDSIADITPHEPERLHALEQSAACLERLCEGAGAPPGRFVQCAQALINARRPQDAVSFAQANSGRFTTPAAAHNALARAHYAGGAFRKAFHHKARALAALEANTGPQQAPFSPGQAALALRAMSEILTAHAIAHFLAAGTLLGFYRNGAPLAHDRDVDIGVIRNADGSPDIAGLMRTHPRLMLARGARPGDRYFGLMFEGIAIDIFLHGAEGGALVCGLGNFPGDIQWRFSAFGLKRAAWQGLDCAVPDNPERYLAETYGRSWQVPDTGFASAVSSPALYRTDRHARAYYAAARAGAALQAGHHARADALLRQSPVPFVLPVQSGVSALADQDEENPHTD